MIFRPGNLIGLLAVGAVIAATLSTTLAAADSPSATPATAVTKWDRNALGQSYGSAAEARSLGDEPDLIKVVATNGRLGYALRADLETTPSTPRQALAEQKARMGKAAFVPVFLADGLTQIGVFAVDYPEPNTAR